MRLINLLFSYLMINCVLKKEVKSETIRFTHCQKSDATAILSDF